MTCDIDVELEDKTVILRILASSEEEAQDIFDSIKKEVEEGYFHFEVGQRRDN